MFQLNGKPLALDVPFTAEVDVATVIPAVYEPHSETGEFQIVEPEKTVMIKDSIQFPANWLRNASPKERKSLGITEVAEPASYDDRFYWDAKTPKQLEDETITPEEGDAYVQKGLKSQWASQVKDTTNKLLSNTDWMVIRKAERSIAIPAKTVAYRAAVLAECDRAIEAIQAAKNVPALIEVVAGLQWPE